MITPRQRCRRPPGRRKADRLGFTLVEIVLALAIIALMSALVLPGLAGILRTIDNKDPDRILWDAVTAAREQALTANHQVLLSYDAKKRVLAWSDGTAAQSLAWPVGFNLDFLRAKEGGATILLGGQLVETETITSVRFYPDGTCDRFRAQIRASTGNTPAQIIGVDPWTCAPVIGPQTKR